MIRVLVASAAVAVPCASASVAQPAPPPPNFPGQAAFHDLYAQLVDQHQLYANSP